jgi:hypothetical protein
MVVFLIILKHQFSKMEGELSLLKSLRIAPSLPRCAKQIIPLFIVAKNYRKCALRAGWNLIWVISYYWNCFRQLSVCSKAKEGNQTLYRKISGDDGVVICIKHNGNYEWKSLDGNINNSFLADRKHTKICHGYLISWSTLITKPSWQTIWK